MRSLTSMQGGTLVGLFVGIVLGILIATGVVWFMNKTPVPFLTKVLPAPLNDDQNKSPLPLPGKPGDPIPSTLPQAPTGVALPPPTASVVAPPASEVASADPHVRQNYLQAGSFTQPREADKMKAALAMMGLEANVQQVMVQDQTHYRLRLGPYREPAEMDQVRARLAQEGIETAIVKE